MSYFSIWIDVSQVKRFLVKAQKSSPSDSDSDFK